MHYFGYSDICIKFNFVKSFLAMKGSVGEYICCFSFKWRQKLQGRSVSGNTGIVGHFSTTTTTKTVAKTTLKHSLSV